MLGKGFFAAPALYESRRRRKAGDHPAARRRLALRVGRHRHAVARASRPDLRPQRRATADGDKSIQYGRLMTTPAVGDINGDGNPEIIVGSNEAYGSEGGRVYAIWADGNNHAGGPFLPGWPIDPKGLDHKVLPRTSASACPTRPRSPISTATASSRSPPTGSAPRRGFFNGAGSDDWRRRPEHVRVAGREPGRPGQRDHQPRFLRRRRRRRPGRLRRRHARLQLHDRRTLRHGQSRDQPRRAPPGPRGRAIRARAAAPSPPSRCRGSRRSPRTSSSS